MFVIIVAFLCFCFLVVPYLLLFVIIVSYDFCFFLHLFPYYFLICPFLLLSLICSLCVFLFLSVFSY